MRTLKRRLPSLNALLTFEAAARHLSFTRAAEELFVSQAAVSRQIRRLEEQLGTPLFRRYHRSLALTEAGHRLREAVTMGLSHIASAAEEIGASARTEQIQAATTVAFATYWFLPRLNAFRQHYPEVDVRVLASDRSSDHLGDHVDIALTCGVSDVPGWRADRLFSEVVFPVCTPEYLAAHPVGGVGDLPDRVLLHLDPRHWEEIGWEPVSWEVWLQQFGVDFRPRAAALSFNNYPMLIEATLGGAGIALGWGHLCARLLQQGRLVRPVPEEWDSRRSYYLATRNEPACSPECATLRDWLLTDLRGHPSA